MQESSSIEEYKPGYCNIGAVEIKRRYRIGYIGLTLMVLFIIAAEVFHIPQVWKLMLFAPTVYSLSGFLQARQKFCFLYGFWGLASMAGRRNFLKVRDGHDLLQDRSMAMRLVSRVILGSSAITLLYYYLS